MHREADSFADLFQRLAGHSPMLWQRRLFDEVARGNFPASLDLPTGLGKTSVMAIWLLARALADRTALKAIPRRLVYIVDRRAVVDQATAEAQKLLKALEADAQSLKARLDLSGELAISTLRGKHADNRQWLADPAATAIIVGTVDMIGSKLLFEGYGISAKMRPYHAGLLGADTLVVLDEAHLVSPFKELLHSIQCDEDLWPKDRAPVPPLVVLPLSATQREGDNEIRGRRPFGLQPEDLTDGTAAQRLNAAKHITVLSLAEKDGDRQFAEAALALARENGPSRVVVFCNRREKKDDGSGPSAKGVADAIDDLVKRAKLDIETPELLVGSRRTHERDGVEKRLKELGFIGGVEKPEKPSILVATSAGEVGVDLDADHMICDLVPWERMVQRLGRVNRRGGEGRVAVIRIFDTSQLEKDEARRARLYATRSLLNRIEKEFAGQAGPAALLKLRAKLGPQDIENASSPEPFYPALTRALVDAWAMTSLEKHSGRPLVAPWLRGWIEDDKPQTAVLWREFLPLRIVPNGLSVFAGAKDTNNFFASAPLHESELLETETFHVLEWLYNRADLLLSRKSAKDTGAAANGASEQQQPPRARSALQRADIVAIALSPSADYVAHWSLEELARDRKTRTRDFEDALEGNILVVDARFGGFDGGLLESKSDMVVPAADTSPEWEEAKFQVRLQGECFRRAGEWRVEDDFVLQYDNDGTPMEWLLIAHLGSSAQSEDGRSLSAKVQELSAHQSLAEVKARLISANIGLRGYAVEALALAARLHDEGKKAPRWQRAFRAPREKDETGADKIYAKTPGPVNLKILDGYRHEFGSLPYAEVHPDLQALPEDWRELVLHLIAAHHGGARPVIGTNGCEDAPPSALEERAREGALRFAKLQKRWGPWGLAWWEALLRAADHQASSQAEKS